MGLFRRIFSADFRRAVAEEAAGNFIAAARLYAMCGEEHKVVDMHLAQARLEMDPDEEIRELKLALRFAPGSDPRRPMVLRLLGQALRRRGEQLGLQSVEGRALVMEAATVLEQGESFEAAGECRLLLGERNAAAEAFSRAGLLERVEQVLGEEEQQSRRQREEQAAFADYEALFAQGQRDEAAEALRRCVELCEHPAEARELLAELEGRLLHGGRVELRAEERSLVILGRYPLSFGRDGDCDLQVRGPSVSRTHARLRLDPEGRVLLEDAGSRNGTRLGGLPLASALPLPPRGTIGLGDDCELSFEQLELGPAMVAISVTRGLDLGRAAVVGRGAFPLAELLPGAPPLLLTFHRGRPMLHAAAGGLRLNGQPCAGQVQLISGDRLGVGEGDAALEVL